MFAHVEKNNIKTKTQFTEGRGRKNKFRRCNLFSKTALQSNPELASLRVISADPSLAPSRSKTSPCLGIQYECNFSFSRQQCCFGIDTFIFSPSRAQKSTSATRWKRDAFVQQPPPSSQIDGPCNWRPLCAIARINRHWCRQGKSVSGAQGAADMVELMGRHIYRQNTINVSADRSGRLWVARRVTVLLILRNRAVRRRFDVDVWCFKLWVIWTKCDFFFLSLPVPISLFVQTVLKRSALHQQKAASIAERERTTMF